MDEEPLQLAWALQRANAEEALYQTMDYLANGEAEALEAVWIAVLAKAGERVRDHEACNRAWAECVAMVQQIATAEHTDVVAALVCSTSISLLFRRLSGIGAIGQPPHLRKLTLPKLREAVIHWFPEDGQLSKAGLQRFARVLPVEGAEHYRVCVRLLAGLSRVWTAEDGSLAAHRHSVEYIIRKRLQLPIYHTDDPMNPWPAPSLAEAENGDPVWFLWGAMQCCFPHAKAIADAARLFGHGYKRSEKMDRIGLLYGAYCARQVAGVMATEPVWTGDEERMFARVREVAPDLWKDVLTERKAREQERTEADGRRGALQDGIDAMLRFFPRSSGVGPQEPEHDRAYRPEANKKAVALVPGGRKHRHKENLSNKGKDTEHEAHLFDPWDRGVPPREEGRRTQAAPPPTHPGQPMAQYLPLAPKERPPVASGHEVRYDSRSRGQDRRPYGV